MFGERTSTEVVHPFGRRAGTPRSLSRLCLAIVVVFSWSSLAPVSAAESLMSVRGGFEVTARGAASYSIPIAVPPGTAGLAPSLALQYNSDAGNGLLGVGWSLTGLSVIERCPRTVAQDATGSDLASQNAARGSVNYSASDRFCLDGKRLMKLSGAYGADGIEYRTELESYTKVVSYGSAGSGPAYFKVWTKSGQILELGNTPDSQLLVQGSATARSWSVNKISDTNGNYLTVTYLVDAANGELYPSAIEYTGHQTTPQSTPYSTVAFSYDSARPDKTPKYQAGVLTKQVNRLSKVTAYRGTGATKIAVSDYRLTYNTSPGTGRSELASVTLCDSTAGDARCLRPTAFVWSGNTTDAFVQINGQSNLCSVGVANIPNRGTVIATWALGTGDFDGDGKTDLICNDSLNHTVSFSNGDGTFRQTTGNLANWCTSSVVAEADFDGDGKTDLICDADVGGSSPRVFQVAFSNGDGTFRVAATTFQWCYSQTYGWGGAEFGDFNGDGKTDILCHYALNSNNTGEVYVVALSAGNGSFVDESNYLSPDWCVVNYYYTDPQHVIGDLNGDGKADLLCRQTYLASDSSLYYNYYTALAGPNGTFLGGPLVMVWCSYGNTANQGSIPPGSKVNYGDFNGDGKIDILCSDPNGYQTIAFSNGTGGFAVGGAGLAGWCALPHPALGGPPLVADFNGDGKADIICTDADGNGNRNYALAFSRGDGTFVPVTSGSGISSLASWCSSNSAGAYSPGLATGDFNGDGKADLLCIKIYSVPDGAHYVYNRFVALKTGEIDAIKLITTGLGEVTSVTYKPLTDPSIYTKGSGAVYPDMDVQGSDQVVQQVSVSNGLGGNFVTTYSYSTARTNWAGRGFLGLAQVKALDQTTGVLTTTNYRQDYPFIGLASRVTKEHTAACNGSSPLIFYQQDNTFDAQNLGGWGTHKFPFLKHRTETTNDLDCSSFPQADTDYTYTFDANGLPTRLVTNWTSAAFSKIVTDDYANDTANWRIAQLVKSSSANSAPDLAPPPANTGPSAVADGITVGDGRAVTFDPRANDSDPDGDPLTVTAATNGAHGTTTIGANGTQLTFTASGSYVGPDSFTYTISDGHNHTASATVTVTILPSAVWGSFTWGGAIWGP